MTITPNAHSPNAHWAAISQAAVLKTTPAGEPQTVTIGQPAGPSIRVEFTGCSIRTTEVAPDHRPVRGCEACDLTMTRCRECFIYGA